MNPANEQELAEIIQNTTAPLAIRGGGTRPIGGPVAGETVTTTAMNGVVLYEPGSLTIVVRAGTPMADVEKLLAQNGQRLAFEPMDHRPMLGSTGTPTIGGVVAANVSGPRRIQSGACRDFLLGVRFVDGAGNIIKNGGRVMKNVTGYDLVKLMAGSYGTLGVLTEVSLKVLPQPQATASVILRGLNNDDAQKAMSRALGSPFDISGAAHLPADETSGSATFIRVEGFDSSVAYRVAQLKDLLKSSGDIAVQTDSVAAQKQWSDIRDVTAVSAVDGDLWRLSVKPSDGPAIARLLKAKAVQFDWGGGLIWAVVQKGTDLRSALQGFNGHATLVRANTSTRRQIATFQPEPAPLAALTRGLRAKFDPKSILNQGLMG